MIRVGTKPSTQAPITSTGSFTSASSPPQRINVTGCQLVMPNSTMTTASTTQNRVFRNCMDASFEQKRRAVQWPRCVGESRHPGEGRDLGSLNALQLHATSAACRDPG